MLTDKMVKSISGQINKEIYSAYLYLGMANYAASIGLNGFANWFQVQVKEELFHAQKMYDYLVQHGKIVALDPIDKPPQDFTSAEDLFEKTLKHEQKVTALIDGLVAVAREEKDNETETFLKWYVTEQVEEEASAGGVLQKVKSTKGKSDELSVLDNELLQRK